MRLVLSECSCVHWIHPAAVYSAGLENEYQQNICFSHSPVVSVRLEQLMALWTSEELSNWSSTSGPLWNSLTSFFLVFSRAIPTAYGGSQARGSNQSCSCCPMPQPQQCRIWAASATYTTAHGNAGSLTHWVRPGIKLKTLWFLVGFVNHEATMGTPGICSLITWS